VKVPARRAGTFTNHLGALYDESLSSERFGANYYAKLRDLLAAQDWKAADQETADRMLEVMDRQKDGYLRNEDVKKFPCLDLCNIDILWVKYSQGKFGFSVQKELWESPSESLGMNNNNKLRRFCITVGWETRGFLWMRGSLLLYSQLMFDIAAPRGHFPAWLVNPAWGADRGGFPTLSIFSRLKSL
jgi:hypothetical protein